MDASKCHKFRVNVIYSKTPIQIYFMFPKRALMGIKHDPMAKVSQNVTADKVPSSAVYRSSHLNHLILLGQTCYFQDLYHKGQGYLN